MFVFKHLYYNKESFASIVNEQSFPLYGATDTGLQYNGEMLQFLKKLVLILSYMVSTRVLKALLRTGHAFKNINSKKPRRKFCFMCQRRESTSREQALPDTWSVTINLKILTQTLFVKLSSQMTLNGTNK